MAAQDALTVRNLGGDYLFALENEVRTPREIIRVMPVGSEERRLLQSSRFYTTTGNFLGAFGGAFAGVVIADLLIAQELERDDLLILSGIALGCIAISLPLTATGRRRVEKSVYLFNQREAGMSYRPRLEVGLRGAGAAMVLRF